MIPTFQKFVYAVDRSTVRRFDRASLEDWLKRAIVRSNQFLLLIIRHSHPTWAHDLLRTLLVFHLRHVSILCDLCSCKINLRANLFLNKYLTDILPDRKMFNVNFPSNIDRILNSNGALKDCVRRSFRDRIRLLKYKNSFRISKDRLLTHSI